MELALPPEDRAFQQQVREWLAQNLTEEIREEIARSPNGFPTPRIQKLWQKRLHARGWIGLTWPVEYGGPGLSLRHCHILELELGRAGAPNIRPEGLLMVAPVIMRFGTPEQQRRFLPGTLSTDIWWCQGYSEPGSGSDLASLSCRAEERGDHFVVNGTKTWTTVAQHADMIFCLVRTSREARKQQGISFLLIDMHAPGVTVQPIVTLDGAPPPHQEVNTVFFEDVAVPRENLIGEVGQGWTYAKYLLEFERGNTYSPRLHASLAKLHGVAQAQADGQGGPLAGDPQLQAELAALQIQIQALEATELRILGALAAGQRVGPESSLLKTRGTEIGQLLSEKLVQVVGHHAQPRIYQAPFDSGAAGNQPPVGPPQAATAAMRYFNQRKASIYGGSNEIQRSIMAKLVLGL